MSSSESDFEFEDGDDLFDDDDLFFGHESCEAKPIHPSIQQDIEQFAQRYPSEKIVTFNRTISDLPEFDVEMTMSLDFIKRNVLDAWGISPMHPLVLKLTMDSAVYYQDKYLKVDVCQSVKQKQKGALTQLRNIARTFCSHFHELDSRFDKRPGGLNRNPADEADPSRNDGFLVQLYSYLKHRLATLNEYCPICDKFHGHSSMLKPIVCSSPLCIFSSQTLGVMCEVTDALDSQPQVVKLLVAFTNAAALSERNQDVLNPYPVLLDKDSHELLFPKDEKGLVLMRKVLNTLSSVKFPNASSDADLMCFLNSCHNHSYQMLRWIMSSCRSHLMYLPTEKQIDIMDTKHQFAMRNSPPAEELNFRALSERYGSCYAFHGSPLENWHSIVRQGLIVASGTDLQLHGATWGKGIYVTEQLSFALSYSGLKNFIVPNYSPQKSFTRSAGRKQKEERPEEVVDSKNYHCVALCEVVLGPEVDRRSAMWIVRSSQHIRTRFFFLYPTRSTKKNINSTSQAFLKSVKKVLSDI